MRAVLVVAQLVQHRAQHLPARILPVMQLSCCTTRRPLAHMQRPTPLLAVHKSTADIAHKTGTAACPCPEAGQRSKGLHLLIVQKAPATGIAQTQLYHLALVDVEALRQRSCWCLDAAKCLRVQTAHLCTFANSPIPRLLTPLRTHTTSACHLPRLS